MNHIIDNHMGGFITFWGELAYCAPPSSVLVMEVMDNTNILF